MQINYFDTHRFYQAINQACKKLIGLQQITQWNHLLLFQHALWVMTIEISNADHLYSGTPDQSLLISIADFISDHQDIIARQLSHHFNNSLWSTQIYLAKYHFSDNKQFSVHKKIIVQQRNASYHKLITLNVIPVKLSTCTKFSKLLLTLSVSEWYPY